ncbi:DNA primase small subunit PriS [Candidatus Gugararchaeum adminiculabundum]|nr:DNA primase small subunit PriS [Candidatus Gugararchaeum adminiculabundum]
MTDLERTVEFVRRKFADFYTAQSEVGPSSIGQREFGFGSWERKIETRHAAFPTKADLRKYLVMNAPFFISHSIAYYEFPTGRPMPRKNWLGGDLVFDLDADECPNHAKGWICDTCFGKTKSEAIKLIEEFLMPDFGFSSNEISVNFSGNRGFHVRVESEKVKQLDREARRDLVDYIGGTGLSIENFFRAKEKSWMENDRVKRQLQNMGPKPTDPGWGGRIARFAIDPANIAHLPKEVQKKKFPLFTQGVKEGNWDKVRIANKETVWGDLGKKVGVHMGDQIDQNVTIDTSKLIRMADSLHGDSGWVAKTFPLSQLQSFDPRKDALAFSSSETVTLNIVEAPKFLSREEEFGPFKAEKRELPLHAAMYLLCKKAALLSD